METLITIILLALAISIFVVAMIAYNAFAYGVVMLYFWDWFVTPIFTTLPSLTFYQAVGLVLFLTLAKNHKIQDFNQDFKDKYVDSKSTLISFFISPWLALGGGWLINWMIK